MAYLSPIPRRRDRKGAGTARILALLGRAGLAEMQRRKSVREAAQKAAQEAEKIAYERGKDQRTEARAEEGLELRRDEAARGREKDEYQKERDAIADLYRDADLADKKGDNARADEYLRLAKERESRLKAADARSAAKDAAGGGGDGTQGERDRQKWISAFSGNFGMLPAGLDQRLKVLLEGKTATEATDILSKAFFGGEEGEGSEFHQPIPRGVLADPAVLDSMWNYVSRHKADLGIIGDTEGQRSAFMEAVKKMFVWGYGSKGEEGAAPTEGGGTYEDEIDALLGE